MKLNTWIPLGLALVLGLAAMIVAKGVLGKSKGPSGPAQVKVVGVKDNVPPGSRLTPELLTLVPVTGTDRPEGAYDSVAALTDRVVTTQIVKGQVVLDGFLAPPGSMAGVQNLVPDGMRLITVEVNEFSSLAGMLSPGSRVDILAALSDPDSKEMMARTIVSNVKVQAVGQRLGTGPAAGEKGQPEQEAGFRSVTLVVSPQEAEAIHVAGTAGRPWMVLRGPNDNAMNDSPGVTLAFLRGNGKADKGHQGLLGGAGAVSTAALTKPAAPANGGAATQPTVDATKKPGRTITFIKAGKIETITIEEPDTAAASAATTAAPAPAAAPAVTPVEAAPAAMPAEERSTVDIDTSELLGDE
jgi:pilus assembly protein CpaB